MIEVDQLSPQEWTQYSEHAHLIAFGEHKPAEWDRISFTLVARRGSQLLGYITCRENDAHTIYWQFGGSFPGTKGTTLSWDVVQAMMNYTKVRYKRVCFLVENTNRAMLKMALKLGFLVVGLRLFKGSILLEHLLEFEA